MVDVSEIQEEKMSKLLIKSRNLVIIHYEDNQIFMLM